MLQIPRASSALRFISILCSPILVVALTTQMQPAPVVAQAAGSQTPPTSQPQTQPTGAPGQGPQQQPRSTVGTTGGTQNGQTQNGTMPTKSGNSGTTGKAPGNSPAVPNGNQPGSERQTGPRQPQPAANPLILPNPDDLLNPMQSQMLDGRGNRIYSGQMQDGNGNYPDYRNGAVQHDYSGLRPGAQMTSKVPHDYTHPTRPTVIGPKQLNAFGYDYFAGARATVDAMRAYYQGGFNKQGASAQQPGTTANKPTHDTGSIEPDAGSVTTGSDIQGVSGAIGGNSANSGSATDAAAAALAGGVLGQGSVLGANGVSPVTGQTSVLTPTTVSTGTAGTDNSLLVAPPPPPAAVLQGGQPLPENLAPIDVRNQVFGPIQGQFHNIIANAPPNYQLGPGDVITIEYSSPTRDAQVLHREVDSTGKVNLQGLGMVSLVGKTIANAEKSLETVLQRYWKGAHVSVSLDQIRTVTVAVVGHAYEPGTYSVPAVIATAYNLLWWAGGPSDDGTLRDIEVRRLGKTVGTLDMYKYELGGGNADDIQLQSGDVLYVPAKLSSVAVQGEVRTEALYELKPNETLQDAIQFTGGVKASAVAQRIQINTVQPGASRVLRDIDLTSPAAQKTPIFDGDIVEVLSVRDFLTNSVTIEGAVDQPSDYALTPNMRVSDLVNRARGLLSEAYPIAELHHWNTDNTDTLVKVDLEKALIHDAANDLALTRWDRIKVYTRDEVAWTGHHFITIDGQVRRHGIYTSSKNMHVSDALRMAGGPQPNAYLERAVLIHQHEDGPPTMEFVNIGAIINGDLSKDPLVQDNDHLAVYAVGQAQFTPDHIVSVDGEVVAPGPYPRADNMKLTALLAIAGGFKPDAGSVVVVTHARRVLGDTNSNLVRKAVTFDALGHCPPADDVPLEDGDVVTIQGKGGFVDKVQTVVVSGRVNAPGPIPITTTEMRLSDAIKLSGGLLKDAYPMGAEFHRNPKLMLTDTQQSMAQSIGKLRDLLNGTAFQRESAKARLDVITATGEAQADSAGGLLGGLVGGGAAAAALPAVAAGAVSSQLASGQVPVSPARLMGEGQNEPDGAVAINLPLAMQKPGGHEDILLKDGDQITIPETPTTVGLLGAVYHPSSVVWQPGKHIDYYINRAGGFTFDAAKDGIEVIRAGGGIIPAKKAREILPGDVILVPTKPIAASIAKHGSALNDFFKSLTSSVLLYGIAKNIFGL